MYTSLYRIRKVVKYFVKVTNTGTVDSDDVVLGFLVPPNAGKDGVPLQTLFGFERVHVKAGQSQLVSLYPSLTEFSQVKAHTHGAADTVSRVPVAGEYRLRVGLREAAKHGMGFAEHRLVVS